jgi:hypothetical protein
MSRVTAVTALSTVSTRVPTCCAACAAALAALCAAAATSCRFSLLVDLADSGLVLLNASLRLLDGPAQRVDLRVDGTHFRSNVLLRGTRGAMATSLPATMLR